MDGSKTGEESMYEKSEVGRDLGSTCGLLQVGMPGTASNSVHVQGSSEYQERVERGLSGDDKPIALLLGPAHDLSAMYGPDYSTIKHLPTPFC